MKINKSTIGIIILGLVLVITLIVGIKRDNQITQKNHLEAMQYNQQQKEKNEQEKQRISNLNVYEKLKENDDISVLVLGDSIGGQSGKETDNGGWIDKVQAYLSKNYKCKVNVNNISAGSTISYRGYNEFMQNKDLHDYNLVFICFGQNDQGSININQFNIVYENLIRQVKKRNSKCDIIPIIESSMREYNDYSNSIVNLSNYYGFNYADTIESFKNSGIDYSQLSKDGTHPNDKGYDIYSDTIEKIIDKNVSESKNIKTDEIVPYNTNCTVLDNFKFIDIKSMTSDKNTYMVETTGSFIGISYLANTDGGKVNVYVNDKLTTTIDTNLPFEASKANIIADNLSGKNTIKFGIVQEEGKKTQILGLITNES